MIFSKPSQRKVLLNQQITFGNTTLKDATVLNYPDVKFDSELKFHEGVKNAHGKMAVAIRTLSVIAQKLTLVNRLALLECLMTTLLFSHALLI